MLYLKGGFSIPVNKNDVSEVKRNMTSRRRFKKYLEERSWYEDMIMNRDI